MRVTAGEALNNVIYETGTGVMYARSATITNNSKSMVHVVSVGLFCLN